MSVEPEPIPDQGNMTEAEYLGLLYDLTGDPECAPDYPDGDSGWAGEDG
jgi:hypothetical protein